MKSVSLKFSVNKQNNDVIRQMSKVLSLVTNVRPVSLGRHWLTALSTTLCFSSVLMEIRRCI